MKQAPTLAHRALAWRRDEPARGWLESAIERLAERALRRRLAKLAHGRITLVDDSGCVSYGAASPRCNLACTLHVRDPRFYAEVAFGGSVGAGESFMAGDWNCDDLTALVRILLVNRGLLDQLDAGLSAVSAQLRRLLHAAARNTRSGSRRNIAAHYDIGNDFFERLLDPSMTYSCAFYADGDMSLEGAQHAKLERLCRKLDLHPEDHLLEIGTGWGALAIHAARHHGCRVTTTTISQAQYASARQRIDAAGLGDRITLLLADYRDLTGRFDKLVSVEMIEAVGAPYFDTFFARAGALLVPGGTMVLQSITIDDRQYEAARDAVDFIKRHVFPGCCIPSVGVLTESIVRASTLRIVDLEDIGPHYARTLAAWRDRLFAHADALRARGYSEALLRMFEFYLGYCEGGFAERALGDVQMVLQDTRRAVQPTPRV